MMRQRSLVCRNTIPFPTPNHFPERLQQQNVGIVNTVIDNSKIEAGMFPTEKIGFDSIISICPASKLNTLITDRDASENDLKAFDELGIDIVIAEKE